MTTSGRWQNDVLRELNASAEQPAPDDGRLPLPVRQPDEQRPHPGQPRTSARPAAQPAGPQPMPQPMPQAAPPPVDPPHQAPPAPPAPAQPHPTAPSPAAPPPGPPRPPVASPESVPTLDPRLAYALGTPQHGDSLARRTGRGLRKLASSAAHDVGEETRLAGLLQQPVTTGRVIAVTSIRGGAGKTTTSALLTRTLSHYRHDPVLALDADSALGTLPVRLGAETVRWSATDLAQILTPSMQLTDVTGYLAPIGDGGWLLPASQGRLGVAPLDIPTYRKVTLSLRRYFAVTVVDCESLPGEIARTAMATAHARIVVAPQTAEGVNGSRIVLDWLAQLPQDALASTIVALTTNSTDPSLELKVAMAHLRETGVTVVHLPYDRHLAGGGPIRTDRLGEATRRAATELSAEAMQRAVRVR
ncbi:MinD/ParA family protein [Streptomyces sp. NBC_01016]|uniref:MinD/ParA family ATP-binding protein n=1 Tax=Streptomyces sp. NBC_01016 TaxID=2903720 RepID=UPI00225B2F91|nr:MinD/ParA family protein [Streptomyces sp. NBC_01016]